MIRSEGGRDETKDLARPDRTKGGSERKQGIGRDKETENEGGSHGGKGGQRKKLSRGEVRSGVRGWLKQKKRQDEDRTRFLTGSLASVETGKFEGRRSARSKYDRDCAVRVTERGGSPASSRRRGVGEVVTQPVMARHAEWWRASRGFRCLAYINGYQPGEA